MYQLEESKSYDQEEEIQKKINDVCKLIYTAFKTRTYTFIAMMFALRLKLLYDAMPV